MVRIPTHRAPIHPGEILQEEFLKSMELTQKPLTDGIHVPYQRINELVSGRLSGKSLFYEFKCHRFSSVLKRQRK